MMLKEIVRRATMLLFVIIPRAWTLEAMWKDASERDVELPPESREAVKTTFSALLSYAVWEVVSAYLYSM